MSTVSSYRLIDRVGQRYGRLLVIERAYSPAYKSAVWLCQCDCGRQVIASGWNLSRSYMPTRSCGCLRRDMLINRNSTHGKAKKDAPLSAEYTTWQNIKRRTTTNVNSPSFSDYGARGIVVCERWLHSFENFLADMGPRPSPQHSIDRINNDGPYAPENCRWATPEEQHNNKRNNHFLTFQDQTMTIAQWAEKRTDISEPSLRHRIKNGWSIERALTTPTR